MVWWIIVITLYIIAVLLFHTYVRYISRSENFGSKALPVIVEPWYCPFLGPVLSMLNMEASLAKWRVQYGENFTVRIFGYYLTLVTEYVDVKKYYHANEESLSLTRAAHLILGSSYPESQYMVEYSSVPFLQMILTPPYLRHMSANMETALVDYFNNQNGQFWAVHGDGAVVNLFDFMYRLVLRMNCANFASPTIYANHVDEWIALFSTLDNEKGVTNPFGDGLKKRLGIKSKRDSAWQRWIELLMPDVDRCLAMIDQKIEPTEVDVSYERVKYAKEQLEKRGEVFTPRLVAFLAYSSFLPAQLNTYATAAFVVLEWIRHEHDEIGQRMQDDIQRVSSMADITLQDLNSMEYIQACIYEVIRFRTDAQLSLRYAGQDILLTDGRRIPAGNLVATCMSGSQKLYPDPEKFDPERHLAPREENKIDPYKIIPFGRGKHACTGERYVKMQIKLLLIHLSAMCKMSIMKESINFETTVNKKQLAGLSRPTKPVYVRISKRDV